MAALNELDQFNDPAWRLSHIYSIVDKGANRRTFRPNPIQARLNQSTAKRRIILKARQFGVSTNEILRQLDFVLFNENATACILAHEQDAIEKLFRIARRAYNFLHPSIQPELDRGGGSKYEMFFPALNSRIYCDLESRGDTIHWLHVSEAAFIKEPDRMRSTIQAVPMSGRVTIETTPNGMGNHFYDLWMDSKQVYEKLFFPWFMFPEYRVDGADPIPDPDELDAIDRIERNYGIRLTGEQLMFRRIKQAELGLLFGQEYPEDDQSCFIASGAAVMDLGNIKRMLDQAPKPLHTKDGIMVWESARPDGVYVIGADCSEGISKDYSAAIAIEAKSMRQVAAFRGKLKPSDFAKALDQMGRMFERGGRFPVIAVERNNHGHAVIQELNEHLSYPHLYVSNDDRLGWLTDRVSRPLMLDGFIDAVDHCHVKLLHDDTLRECLTLIDNNGKIEAATGKHDDCVMAAAIATQLAVDRKKTANLYDNISTKIRV